MNTDTQNIIDPKVEKNIISYSRPGDEYGYLGNMKGGYPFKALGREWRSSEFLYLLGEWSNPDQTEIQKDVLTATSGYAAKRYKKSRYNREIRSDFKEFRHEWMLWVVWQKCSNTEFKKLLLSLPEDCTIVEVEKNDPVWAACELPDGTYQGANGMGRILNYCKRCLHDGIEPNIDRELLNRSNIYILGQKVEF